MNDADILPRIGDAIRQRRLEVGLSQDQLATKSGLGRSSIINVERGDSNISLTNLVAISNALGLDIVSFMEGLRHPSRNHAETSADDGIAGELIKDGIVRDLFVDEEQGAPQYGELRSIDLFAGIGGIRMGFDQAFGKNINTVFVSEWDSFAQKTYATNFPSIHPINGDITKIDEKDVPDFDICLAGFPCQAFSLAGQRKGFDDDDYVYDVLPEPDGRSARVYRRRSPDIQLTLGIYAPKNGVFADELPATFEKTPDGYVYTVTFPAKYVLPLRLEKGRCVGFGISVSDANDPKAPFGKRYLGGLVNTVLPGKGPYDHPERWPVVLLWE